MMGPVMAYDEAAVRMALEAAWSARSARQWTPENPAAGQCNVTAALVADLFDAEVLKTPLPDGAHFYNRIGGWFVDFTAGQFDALPDYRHFPSSRAEAIAGVTPQEYEALRADFLNRYIPPESGE